MNSETIGGREAYQVGYYTTKNTRAVHDSEKVKGQTLVGNMFLDGVDLCVEEWHIQSHEPEKESSNLKTIRWD